MADIYGQYLRYALSESAASTFTLDAIPTGCGLRVGGGTGIAMEIHSILGLCSNPQDLPATGALEYVTGAISTNGSLAAMPSIDASSVLYKTTLGLQAGVGTYLPLVHMFPEMPPFTQFSLPILIAHPTLYACVLSTNSANAASFKGFLFHTYVDVDGQLAIEALEVFRA